jgi:hypothetical protein
VCPGPTDAPPFQRQLPWIKEAPTRAIRFRHIAQPSEIADAVLFFLSDRANYITGQVLSVSGGLTMADRQGQEEQAMRSYQAAALAALMITAAGSAQAQPQAPMPENNPAAAANVKQSEQYSALLRSNPGFRRQREKIECGPIEDSQLRASCIASFEAYAAPAK